MPHLAHNTRPRLVIAGTHSGVGKTTVTLALLAAWKAKGVIVQPFKGGPDYIDPGYHQAVTGRPARNLDGWMLGEAVNRASFARASDDAELSLVEGMMGLFDGSSATQERGSTAELAKQLRAPVLLVIDGSAMARSAAAMAAGYARFDPALSVQAVLFNRVRSDGHYRLLREAVEAATDLSVLGYLRPDEAVTIPDRHLGLRTAIEQGQQDLYDRLGRSAAETVDLAAIETLARSAEAWPDEAPAALPSRPRSMRIAVAYDNAFCFYYHDNFDLFEAAGAELVRFSPLHDAAPPEADLLYFGGGYPELYGAALAANHSMRRALRRHAERGGAIFAECGGLMYLTQAVRDLNGQRHDMVGIFPADAVMQQGRMTLGYRRLTTTAPCLLGPVGTSVRGHEFHYSALEPSGPLTYACTVADAEGRPIGQDGLTTGRVLAFYSHLHFASGPEAATALIEAACRSTASAAALGKD